MFDATYQRYLLNTFRQKLPFHDVPMKLYMRARTQSDPNAPKVEAIGDLGPRDGKFRGEKPRALDIEMGDELRDLEVNELLADLND